MYRVLIVEDEIIVREWLKKRVNWEGYGFEVCGEASNGQEGLEVYKREKPDIILTDLRMPVMDGLTMLQGIREHDKRTRFLILTCLDEFSLVKQAIGLDVTSYILKLTSEPDEIEKELLKARDFFARLAGEEEQGSDEPQSVVNPRLAAALEYLEENYTRNISLVHVAEWIGVTPNYLGKLFLEYRGCTFTDELNRLRIAQARKLLDNPACRIYEIAEEIGFANTTYFFRVFKKYVGCTPTEYRTRETVRKPPD